MRRVWYDAIFKATIDVLYADLDAGRRVEALLDDIVDHLDSMSYVWRGVFRRDFL